MELGLSQPAVSQAIGRLERTLGVRLFDRTSREVRLTAAGEALLPYAGALLGAAREFAAEAARLAEPAAPAIRLAYAPVVGTLAARVARRLGRRGIGVELRPAGRRAALAGIAGGEVSAAVLAAPFPADLATAARFHVPVAHLAVPAGDPLATAARLRPDRLGGRRVLMPRERPPGGMWARLAARLPAPGGPYAVADEIDDFAAALDLVAAGTGVLPVPQLLVRSVRRDDVRFVPLDVPGLRITYALAWRPDRASADLLTLAGAVQETLWTR